VDFWIKVFRTWETTQIVFHDTLRPERVYSVKTTDSRCSRKRPGRGVTREKRRIRWNLQQIAAKLEAGGKKWSREQKQLLTLFPDQDPNEVRRASKNIRCQQGNRDRFEAALQRYGRYRDYVVRVLRDHGLSEDIQYLPFVESAYNPRAYSPAGAAGMWQIMPRTARKLGLQLNATIDERFDPQAATWGAARYLSNATKKLRSAAEEKTSGSVTTSQINPFVITSYNYGVTGMRRAIKKFGPDYVTVLRKYKSRTFRTAVRNFYASFLAARHVAKNAKKYFGDVDSDGAMRYTLVSLKHPTSVKRVKKVFRIPDKELKRLNPALTRYVWRGWRLIPEGYALRLPYRKDDWRKTIAKLEGLPPEQPQLSGHKYVVQRGDTACAIAEVFNVRCRDLIQVNGLGRRAVIRVGQKLDIPGKPRRPAKTVVAKAPATTDVKNTQVNTKVDKGKQRSMSSDRPPAPASTEATKTAKKEVMPEQSVITMVPAVANIPAVSGQLVEPLIQQRDLNVVIRQHNGDKLFSIRVEPEETLGHYADWLGIGFTSKLRKLNHIKPGTQIRVGRWVNLPIRSMDMKEAFEQKRGEYHRTLVDEFRQHYEIVGLDAHKVRKGDSLWRIAQEYELPYWLLTRYNADNLSPNIGERIVVPSVKAKKPQKEPPLTHAS
jgi:membrane-bound lytic murein transglycosylase D